MQTSGVVNVRIAGVGDAGGCAAVLAALPDFFTPDTHAQVAPALGEHRGWAAVEDDAVIGFVIAEVRYRESAEITFAAVLPDRRGAGIGTALVNEALATLANDGVKVVEVKTLDASSGYEPYVATRAFWEGAWVPANRLHRPAPRLAARQPLGDLRRRPRTDALAHLP